MSFVINANAQGDGAFMVSNQNIIYTYPDFRGSILLMPEGYVDGSAAENLPTAFSVNGTVVHSFAKTISDENFFSAINISQTFVLGKLGLGALLNPNIIFRFGFNEPFAGGEVIGKDILIPSIKGQNTYNNYVVNVKIGLLHTDGSITFVDNNGTDCPINKQLTTPYEVKYYNGWGGTEYNANYCISVPVLVHNAGITAQAGDYLICQLEQTTAERSNLNCIFGCDMGRGPMPSLTRPEPIQISIE